VILLAAGLTLFYKPIGCDYFFTDDYT